MSDGVFVRCPCCGVEHEDMDGFGVLTCEMCGYCSHPSVTGGRCDSCDRPVPRSAAAPRIQRFRKTNVSLYRFHRDYEFVGAAQEGKA